MLHYGHLEFLRRARGLGDHLTVGLSTEAFNSSKGKKSYFKYADRRRMLEAIRYVDKIIPESDWEQKLADIHRLEIDVFVIGDDWQGKFDYLREECEVVYLTRTPEISTSMLKSNISID